MIFTDNDLSGSKAWEIFVLKRAWLAVLRGNWKLYSGVYLGFTILFYFVSMVINPLVTRGHGWLYSADFFAELRDAHLITWGGYQLLYASGTSLVAPPLGPLSLTPLAMISSLFGFVEPFPIPFPRPQVLFITIPYLAIFATFFFFAVRRFTSRFGIRKSLLLEIGVTVVASFVLMPWGHTEDVAAMAFALLGFVALSKNNYRSASYLFGVAVAFQPFAVLFVVPSLLILVYNGRESLVALIRTATPAFVVYIPLLLTSPVSTVETMLHQDNFPSVDHLTVVGLVIKGPSRFIAAGPPRLLLVLVVLGVSIYIRYARRDSIRSYGEVFLIVALLSAGRVFFEPVMVPYYLVPTLVYLMLAGVFFGDHFKVRTIALLVASSIEIFLASLRLGPVAYSVFVYLGVLAISAISSTWYLRATLKAEVLRQSIEPYRYGGRDDFDDFSNRPSRRSRFRVVPNEARIDLDDVAPGGIVGGLDS